MIFTRWLIPCSTEKKRSLATSLYSQHKNFDLKQKKSIIQLPWKWPPFFNFKKLSPCMVIPASQCQGENHECKHTTCTTWKTNDLKCIMLEKQWYMYEYKNQRLFLEHLHINISVSSLRNYFRTYWTIENDTVL